MSDPTVMPTEKKRGPRGEVECSKNPSRILKRFYRSTFKKDKKRPKFKAWAADRGDCPPGTTGITTRQAKALAAWLKVKGL